MQFAGFYLLCEGLLAFAGRYFFGPRAPGPITVGRSLITEASHLFAALLATFAMARREGRGVLSFGFTGTARLRLFLLGTVTGFVALSLLLGILWAAGAIVFEGWSLAGVAALRFAFAWTGFFVVLAFYEEACTRGYPLDALAAGFGFWPASLLLSLVFLTQHLGNGGESTVGLITVFAAGMLFCISRLITKSLWWAVGFHAAWDWAQSYFSGVPDSGLVMQGHLLSSHPAGSELLSGGSAGPEGSVLAPVTFGLVALGLWILRDRFTDSDCPPETEADCSLRVPADTCGDPGSDPGA